MNERFNIQDTYLECTSLRTAERITLLTEVRERETVFPFPGLDPVIHQKLLEEEKDFSALPIPIDLVPITERLLRFSEHGMKVVPGNAPHPGNCFVVPGNCAGTSSDVQETGLMVQHLAVENIEDPALRKLVLFEKSTS